WALIEESWRTPAAETHNTSKVFHIKRRLNSGERSTVLISAITELVSAKLSVEAISEWQLEIKKPPRQPRNIEDLLSANLTSGEVVNPEQLGLSQIDDLGFLVPLANALDAAVIAGLDIARRIGWDDKRRPWRIGLFNRVYYVPTDQRQPGDHEP